MVVKLFILNGKVLLIGLVWFFLGFFLRSNIFIPTSPPKLPYAPKMTSNLFKEAREKNEKEELDQIGNVVTKIVKSNDKDLKKQAEELIKDRSKFDKLLSVVSGKGIIQTDKEEKNLNISKELEKIFDSFYLSKNFKNKKISILLKNSNINEALELIGKTSNINFIVDPRVRGFVSNINLKDAPIASALKIILSSNTPRLAMIKDMNIFRILNLKDAIQVLKNKAVEIKIANVVSDFRTIYNAKWSESFKLRIEKMWDGLSSIESKKNGSYIVFDDNTKKIFFKGEKQDVSGFKKYLKQIDIHIPQVRIEARIIIAAKDFEESFGLQSSGVYNRSANVSNKGWSYVGYGPVTTGGKGDIDPKNLMDWTLNLLPSGASQFLNIPFIFGGKNLDTKRLNLVLNVAESRNEIETILKPTLLVNSEEPAHLLVGQEVPIETSVQERLEGSLRDINTINYKDLGLKLKIKPIVSPNNKNVFLDIFVENSYVKDSNNTKFDAKTSIIATTRSHNKVLLKSGQTTLIGGLISNEKRIVKSGVPYLQDIPILGLLFKGSKRSKSDDQLMIFITSTII